MVIGIGFLSYKHRQGTHRRRNCLNTRRQTDRTHSHSCGGPDVPQVWAGYASTQRGQRLPPGPSSVDEADLLELDAPVGLHDVLGRAARDLAVADVVEVVRCAQATAAARRRLVRRVGLALPLAARALLGSLLLGGGSLLGRLVGRLGLAGIMNSLLVVVIQL